MPPRSSSLLIAEPPLIVLPTLATLVGLNEAIFLQQLHYWLTRSGKERDGRLWVYNTYDEWREQLPFWSRATLRRIVNGLEERGLVISTDAYNASKVDRTKWYTIDYAAVDHLLEPADDMLTLSTSTAQTDQVDDRNVSSSIPESTSESTPERSFEASNGPQPSYDPARDVLLPYVEDIAREFRDAAPLGSTLTRVVRLRQESGLDDEAFIGRLLRARQITKERTGAIRSGEPGRRQQVAYWLKVVEDLAKTG